MAASTPESVRSIRVIASGFPGYCFAANLIGTNGTVALLSPAGEGPHSHQLTPAELRKLQTADLVVINGLGLEPWSDRLRELSAKTGRPKIVACSSGLNSELIESGDEGGHDHKNHREASHQHSERFNPHIWLDPLLARHAATNIAMALIEVAPSQKTSFEAQLTGYSARLEQLHQEIARSVQSFSTRGIVTYHDAFPYFLKRYQLKLVGVIQPQEDGSALPKSLSMLSRKIRSAGIKVIFAEPQFNQRLARRLGSDLGVQVDSLDTLETGPETPGGYEDAMRKNLKTLERHLR